MQLSISSKKTKTPQSKASMATLLHLSRTHRYNYSNYCQFYLTFVQLLDLGSYKLSWPELSFYTSRAYNTSPTSHCTSPNWWLGSLFYIKQQLSQLSNNELIRLSDYFLGQHYRDLILALNQQRGGQISRDIQIRAGILTGIIYSFNELLGEQLHTRHLETISLHQNPHRMQSWPNPTSTAHIMAKKLLKNPAFARLNCPELENDLLSVRQFFS